MAETKTEAVVRVQPVEQLVSVRVVAEAPHWLYFGNPTPERFAKRLEEWARDLEAFVRDHRSQDPVSLTVERDVQILCSGCGRPWETMGPDEEVPYVSCAWCGEPVAEQEVS